MRIFDYRARRNHRLFSNIRDNLPCSKNLLEKKKYFRRSYGRFLSSFEMTKFLLIKRQMWIFKYQVSWTVYAFHFFNHRIGSEGIERFSLSNTYIDEIFFESQILSCDFKITDVVSFGGIYVENPHVVDSESTNKQKCKNIGLSEAETVILSRSFSLGEEWECTAFHDQYVCIHNLQWR